MSEKISLDSSEYIYVFRLHQMDSCFLFSNIELMFLLSII